MRTLITGAAGRLGRRLARRLEADHELRLGDVRELDDPRFVPLDVEDLGAARAAAAGCDAIIHMAILNMPIVSREETLGYAVPALKVHAIGTQNLLQAAWEAGVRRFVYISSVSVVDGLPPDVPVDSDCRHYSNEIYGLTKGFGEDLCRAFHHTMGLPVAVLRLGNIFMPQGAGAWLAHVFVPDLATGEVPVPAPSRVHVDDVVDAIALAVETPAPGYVLVHVVGPNPAGQWDLEAARRVYGWEPHYAFGEDGLPIAPPPASAPEAPADGRRS